VSAPGREHRRSVAAMLATMILLGSTAAVGQSPSPSPVDQFGLGRPASVEEIATLDIDVMPDGTGLPAGSGTAGDGAATWARACRGCHGPNGEGGTAAPLVGRDPDARPPTVGNYWPYATTLYDYINRAMPRPTPGTLSPDEVYGLVAWILSKNDIIGADTVVNAESLPGIVMPARNRFVPDNREGGADVRD